MPARLVMTLLVSHEDDLVDATLSYHLSRGVDFVVVIANKAPDAVLEVVQRYVDRGLAHLRVEPGAEHAQARWITRAARLAATEFDADWVINADADEFYWPEVADLKTIFSAIPDRYGTLSLPMSHFLAAPEDGRPFTERLTVREVRSIKPTGHSHLTKTAHRADPQISVSRGGHRVTNVDFEPLLGWEPIVGLHFPFRGYEQFERKVVVAGLADEAAATRETSSERNRRRYTLQREGRLPLLWDSLVAGRDTTFAAQPALNGNRPADPVGEGIAAGRLVRDERLRDFLAGREPGEVRPVAEPDDDAVRAVREELMRAVHEYERSPLHRERRRVERLQTRLAAIESSRWWRLRPRPPQRRRS